MIHVCSAYLLCYSRIFTYVLPAVIKKKLFRRISNIYLKLQALKAKTDFSEATLFTQRMPK